MQRPEPSAAGQVRSVIVEGKIALPLWSLCTFGVACVNDKRVLAFLKDRFDFLDVLEPETDDFLISYWTIKSPRRMMLSDASIRWGNSKLNHDFRYQLSVWVQDG